MAESDRKVRAVSKIFRILVVAAVCLVAATLLVGETRTALTQKAGRPNIVFILADDLDVNSIGRMTRLRSLLVDRGTTFENAFVTYPTCCPSRSTILRGQYAHNHKIKGNAPPAGGFEKFRRLERENSTVATWLRKGGYRTVLIGKYLNGYESRTYVPPGWDKWYGVVKKGYFNFALNENGNVRTYAGQDNYQTDVLKRKAATFIRQQESGSKPFFMYISTKAPHGPATPAPRHQDLFPNVAAPRPPSFNEDDVSDKPSWLRSKPRLDSRQIASIDKLHRKRLQSMMAVDEMIGHLVRELETSGKLRNTYLVFTSDNGFHMGQHRLMPAKRKPYEEDIRVPLIIRGPGVPADRTLEHMVLNNDLARTFARLARVTAPEFVDGRSLMPLLSTNPPATSDWRSAFLVENWKGDSSYKAVRTRNSSYVEYENGERELYDLSQDPYQLHNKINTADPALLKRLSAKLAKLRGCEGASCRAAENTPP